MTPRSLTEAEVRHIVARTTASPSGRQTSAVRLEDVDVAALQRDLTSCAYWYLTANRVRAKGNHTTLSKRAKEIETAASELLRLISDGPGVQCVSEFSCDVMFSESLEPRNMDGAGEFDGTLLPAQLNRLQREARSLLARTDVRRGGFGFFTGSTTDWLVGSRLAWIYEKRLGRKAGISRIRNIKAGGDEQTRIGGAYVQFVQATVEVFRQSHGIEVSAPPNTIAKAIATMRNGGVRIGRVRKRPAT